MSATRLQQKMQEFGDSTSARTLQFPASVTAASLIVVTVGTYNSTSITVTVADDIGSTYQQAGSYSDRSPMRQSVWYAYNVSGGSTATITVTPSASAFVTIAIAEYGGMLTSAGVLDATSTNNGASSSPGNAGSVSVSQAGDVVVAGFCQTGTTGSSIIPTGALRVIAAVGAGSGLAGIACDAVVDAAITPTVTWGSGGAYPAAAASFKAAASGGGGTVYQRSRIVNGE